MTHTSYLEVVYFQTKRSQQIKRDGCRIKRTTNEVRKYKQTWQRNIILVQ